MMPSRGMGAVNPTKIRRKDALVPTKMYCGGGMAKGGAVKKPFWEKDAPEGHKTHHLSAEKKSAAKARARKAGRPYPNLVDNAAVAKMASGGKTEAWTRKEGKNPRGGLNAKGRASYNRAHGAHLKAPQPEGGPRRNSFCARMKGMKRKLTGKKTANDPNSRINKSLRAWNC